MIQLDEATAAFTQLGVGLALSAEPAKVPGGYLFAKELDRTVPAIFSHDKIPVESPQQGT